MLMGLWAWLWWSKSREYPIISRCWAAARESRGGKGLLAKCSFHCPILAIGMAGLCRDLHNAVGIVVGFVGGPMHAQRQAASLSPPPMKNKASQHASFSLLTLFPSTPTHRTGHARKAYKEETQEPRVVFSPSSSMAAVKGTSACPPPSSPPHHHHHHHHDPRQAGFRMVEG